MSHFDRLAHRGPRLGAAVLIAAIALPWAAPAAAQGKWKPNDELPDNHPTNDPYTQGDPELMQAAGIVSLGGFEFGRTTTAEVDEYLAQADIRWIETEHFEIGMALAPYKPGRADKKKIAAELAELQAVLPDVPLKPRSLDPWLRAHLFARRAEAVYARVQQILQVTDEDFPPEPLEFYNLSETFMGLGPYLGQRGKFELLFLPSEGLGNDFLVNQFGLDVLRSQRWNVTTRNTLIAVLVADDQTRKSDTAMHGHMAFNLTVNLLDGYKFYSYELPIWLREGLAHVLEREISPEFNSFDGDEGTAGVRTTKSDWLAETRKLHRKGELPSLSKLSRVRTYGELTLPLHYGCWSKMQFLIEAYPDGAAAVLSDLTGLLDDEGYPDGSNMLDHQRNSFREHLGLTYSQFDAAWAEWLASPAAEAAQTPPPERGPEWGQGGF